VFSRLADLVGKGWSYSLTACRHPGSLPRIAAGVLGGAHLGSLLAVLAQKKWLEKAGIATILDVGAHQGEFASAVLRVLPKVRVYSFEPLPDCHEKLAKRFAGNPRLTSFNLALSDAPGTAQFHRSSFTKSSSLLPMATLHREAFPWSAGSTSIEVPLETLDRVAEKLELSAPVLLKIDVQGAELKVLGGARSALKKIDHVLVEASFAPLYEGQPPFDQLYRCLFDEGYRMNGVWDTLLSPVDGSVLQSDLLFSRPKS
jgi:FkbM family methyltransferase